MPRLLITADLHFNHPRSHPLAVQVIEQMNQAGGDAVLLIGDTAAADGDALEQCLSLFRISGPKLIVPGNHELWTNTTDSLKLLNDDLPRRCAAAGWQWLMDQPAKLGQTTLVGSLGWYDYSFAQSELGIPRRFYEKKVSPGLAGLSTRHQALLGPDVPLAATAILARWNDGTRVKLGMSDDAFLDILLDRLQRQLTQLADAPEIWAAIHCLPFRELLPPSHNAQWDFAKAYLGSDKIGQLLLKFPNIRRVYCGHSHFPAQADVGPIQAVNIGSGYGLKHFLAVDVP